MSFCFVLQEEKIWSVSRKRVSHRDMKVQVMPEISFLTKCSQLKDSSGLNRCNVISRTQHASGIHIRGFYMTLL